MPIIADCELYPHRSKNTQQNAGIKFMKRIAAHPIVIKKTDGYRNKSDSGNSKKYSRNQEKIIRQLVGKRPLRIFG
jgi:hypothetical protein